MQKINSHERYDDIIFILFHGTWTDCAQGTPILLTNVIGSNLAFTDRSLPGS